MRKSKGTVVVTGAAGYLGSVVCQELLAHGFVVRGVDSLRYHGDALLSLLSWPRFEFVHADIRDASAMAVALEGADDVVHLAALVGEPVCARFPEEAREVNHTAVARLAALGKQAGARRFLFASTCSNYGKAAPGWLLAEDDPLQPLSIYSETKIAAERDLLSMASEQFQPVILRFATLFGVSPAMRFDLLVQEFVRDAAVRSELVVYGVGGWRPFLHVVDAARAVHRVLAASPNGGDVVFNVGDERLNCQKGDLARLVMEEFPGARLTKTDKVNDPRDYRVSFERFRNAYDFSASRDLLQGIQEIKLLLDTGVVVDPYDGRYNKV